MSQDRRRPTVVPPFNDQRGKCCWCGGALKGRQTRWCGEACVDHYLIAKGDQSRARRILWKRDAGKCAICKTTPDERKAAGLGRTWDADHAVPIVEGGALAISNLRTLCRPCHLQVTRELRARLSQTRKQNNGRPPSRVVDARTPRAPAGQSGMGGGSLGSS